MGDNVAFVNVQYSFRDDWHIFTSADVHGLYVASKNAEEAFHDLPKSIELLARLNDGVDCDVKPVLSYSEFVRTLKARNGGELAEEVQSTAYRDQSFLVIERAA